jgi:hypothetical protein
MTSNLAFNKIFANISNQHVGIFRLDTTVEILPCEDDDAYDMKIVLPDMYNVELCNCRILPREGCSAIPGG